MAGNIYGPNGAFGNLQPGSTPAPTQTTYSPNWKPGGMYNMGSTPAQLAPAPVLPGPLKPPAEAGTTLPTPAAPTTPAAPAAPTNTYGPSGAFGGQTSAPKLDYLSPQDMVSDAIAQRSTPRFRPLGGLFGVGYRQ